jgi:RNA polymerase II subunit A C-terminal domain phosphatase
MSTQLLIFQNSREFFLKQYLCLRKGIIGGEEDEIRFLTTINWLVKNGEFIKGGTAICEYLNGEQNEVIKAPMDGVLRIYESVQDANPDDQVVAFLSYCHHIRIVNNICTFCKSSNVQKKALSQATQLQKNLLDILKVKKSKTEISNKRPPIQKLESPMKNEGQQKKFCIFDVLSVTKNSKADQTIPNQEKNITTGVQEKVVNNNNEKQENSVENDKTSKEPNIINQDSTSLPLKNEALLYFKGVLDESPVDFYFKIVSWTCKIGSIAKKKLELGKLEIYDEKKNFIDTVDVVCENSGVLYYVAQAKKLYRGDEIIYCQDLCLHQVLYIDICLQCNDKLTSDEMSHREFKPVIAATHHLKFSKDEQTRVDQEISENLLKKQKLLLMLDLDNTLVHSVFCSKLMTYEKADDIFYCYHGHRNKFVVKIRPHLDEFFDMIDSKYDYFIYTKGTRSYAEQVIRNLNVYFEFKGKKITLTKEKLITANEFVNQKSIQLVLPQTDNLHLILDDLPSVWEESDQPNLVFTKPFWYWDEVHNKIIMADINRKYETGEKIKEPIGGDEYCLKVRRKNDNFLHYAALLLQDIHKKFFEIFEQEGYADVTEIYPEEKKTVLLGEKIAFSGMIKLGQSPVNSLEGGRVLLLGGQLTEDIEEATCIITNTYRSTNKIKEAKKLNKPVVHFNWLDFSEMYFKRLDFKHFILTPENPTHSEKDIEIVEKLLFDEIEISRNPQQPESEIKSSELK